MARNIRLSLFTKALPTDGPTDGPTEPVVEFDVFALGVRILDQTAMALS